jgi:hypothetical protein
MIPPSPLQFTLLGSALYSELAAGLWRALAAPWLEPGWPGWACGASRHWAQERRPTSAAGPERPQPVQAKSDRGGKPRSPAAPPEPRVIEVPRAQWQRRRTSRKIPSTEA